MNPEDLSNNVKVSVIIVCFNQQDTIARAIDSVLSQKVDFPFEIIIGDDCSTDATPYICRQYEKKYPDIIKVRSNSVNKGLLNNYYDCVLIAKGKYISDMGGDDFWIDENKLQIEAQTLDKYPDVSLVHTDWMEFNEKDKSLTTPWGKWQGRYPYLDRFAGEYPPFFLLKHNVPVPVHLCTAMYRKDMFLELYNEDNFLFRNKDFIVEDLQLIVMMATMGRFIYIDRPTLAYSVNDTSMTGSKDFTKLFDLYFASLSLTRYLELKLEADHKDLEKVYRGFVHYLTMQAFHAKDIARMRKIKKAIKEWDVIPEKKTRIIHALSGSTPSLKVTSKLWDIYRKYYPEKNDKNLN